MDPETAALLNGLPPKASIGDALDRFVPALPSDVEAVFLSLGATVTSARHLKTSFHKTFLAELDPPLVHEEQSYNQAIVQVIGVQLGDKGVFGDLQVATLVRAHEIAKTAGVRVPAVFATGAFDTALGSLEFIVEEYVATQTIEDRVSAPRDEWHRIRKEVVDKLKGFSLAGVDTSPLPRFETCEMYINQLLQLVPTWDEPLRNALESLAARAMVADELATPVLLHQDINGGNLLCSKVPDGDAWKLDALIDWESAAVVGSRCFDGDDLWRAAQTFAQVVKGVHLAEKFVQDALPRCELGELLENYEGAARRLEKEHSLPFETFASKVAKCRAALTASVGS